MYFPNQLGLFCICLHTIIYAAYSHYPTPKQTGPVAGPDTGATVVVPGGAAGRPDGPGIARWQVYPQPGGGHRLFVHHVFAELPRYGGRLPAVQPAAQPAQGLPPAVAPGAVRVAGGAVVCGVISTVEDSGSL